MSEVNTINTPGEKLALWASLLACQAEIGKAAKDATNPHFRNRYATLDSVWQAVRPTLSKAGIVVTNHIDGNAVITTITHAKTGECISSEFPVPANLTPQQMGSAITYARRYNLCALLQVMTGEDDDGNAAEATAKPKPSETAARVTTNGPEYCPFGSVPTKWESMPTDRLEKALACSDPHITDAHREVIRQVLAARVAKKVEDI